MRPLRLILALSASLSAILFLSYFAASRTSSNSATQGNSNFGAYFNWQSSSLFPPSAIISLTDDNSTFFLARPANFGPNLPHKGLNGQLWIGSGFSDDNLGRGGVASGNGELGCSDVPGWGSGEYSSGTGSANDATGKSKASILKSKTAEVKAARVKRSNTDSSATSDESGESDDGTDDHLHHPLPPSIGLKNAHSSESTHAGKKLAHADIQSLQETAEIAGKVVLLSRGGCGFLEKVKWVQRRGGSALIVGDNVRGGALVTMYARGDTSNVTIPSLFTSHMTAHLLSSLVPSGGFIDDIAPEEAARLGLVLGDKTSSGASTKSDNKQTSNGKQQQSAASPAKDKSSSDSSHNEADKDSKSSDSQATENKAQDSTKQGWFDSLLGGSPKGPHEDTRRPPSSGKIDWVQQKNFEDDKIADGNVKTGKASTKPASQQPPSKDAASKPDSGFVIGVQDWRDPDLLDAQLEAAQGASSKLNNAGDIRPASHGGPKGGSITPGSGEYDQTNKRPVGGKSSSKKTNFETSKTKSNGQSSQDKSDTWLIRLGFSGKELEQSQPYSSSTKPPHVVTQVDKKPVVTADKSNKDDGEELHDGLWVTLTPTSMSSSPFFDTLLVLVISPLVTLTIVYALLLLRSRIRRRRWRAPKSVVDRLPVRTYHTIASTTASNSASTSPSRPPAPATSTTPLLQSDARPISQGGSRPRSRTTSEVPATGNSYRGTNNSSMDPAQEKREAGLAEWRRRYVGRQRECVVCLEEYIDGVSRVMSLPCGHEFHAECISPWLTTRRRTCPICKSDVVRSIAHASASPSTQPLLNNHGSDSDSGPEDSDELQEQIVSTRNDDLSSTEPVSREDEAFEDLERGLEEDRDRSR